MIQQYLLSFCLFLGAVFTCQSGFTYQQINAQIWTDKTITIFGDLFRGPNSISGKRLMPSGDSYSKTFAEAAAIWNKANSQDVKVVYNNNPITACPVIKADFTAFPRKTVDLAPGHCLCDVNGTGSNPRDEECAFGTFELAVTVYYTVTNGGGQTSVKWASINFNENISQTWDVFDTPLADNTGKMDFKRVAVHEIGHLLGLRHIPTANNLLKLDGGSGSATSMGDMGFADVAGLAFDENGNVLYGTDISSDKLIIIDRNIGAATVVGDLGYDNVQGLAFDPGTDTLYGSDVTTDNLITINTTTGSGSQVGRLIDAGDISIEFTNVQGLAYDSQAGILFGVDVGKRQLIRINTASGRVTVVGNLDSPNIQGLAYNSDLNTLIGTDVQNNSLLNIIKTTGQSNLLGTINRLNVIGLAYVPLGSAPANSEGLYGSGTVFSAFSELPIMWPNVTDKFRPSKDDIDGVNAIYQAVPGSDAPPGLVSDVVIFIQGTADVAHLNAVVTPNIKSTDPAGTAAEVHILFSKFAIAPSLHFDENGDILPDYADDIETYDMGRFGDSGNGNDAIFTSQQIPGLACGGGQLYHYIAMARKTNNPTKPVYGKLQQFTTPPCTLTNIIIEGPAFLVGGTQDSYSAKAKRRFSVDPVDIQPVWSVEPAAEASVDEAGILSVDENLAGEFVALKASFDDENVTHSNVLEVPVIWLNNGKPGFGAVRYSNSSSGNADITDYQPVGGSYTKGEFVQPGKRSDNVMIGDVTGDTLHNLILVNDVTIKVYNRNVGIADKTGVFLAQAELGYQIPGAILEDLDGDSRFELIVGSTYNERDSTLSIKVFTVDGGLQELVDKRISGPTVNSTVRMAPLKYLGNDRLLVMLSGGSGNDPRGIAMYDMSQPNGSQEWFYPLATDPTSVTFADDPNHAGRVLLLVSMQTDHSNRQVTTGGGHSNLSSQLATIVLDDSGAEVLFQPFASDEETEAAGHSQMLFVQSGGELKIVAVLSPDLAAAASKPSVVQLMQLDGTVQAQVKLGEDDSLKLAVVDLDVDGDQEIVVLNKATMTLTVYDHLLTETGKTVVEGSDFFISELDVEAPRGKEIVVWRNGNLQILDGISLAEQFSTSFPGELITSVHTGDLAQNRTAEIIVSMNSGKVYVMRTSRGSNNPPRIKDQTLDAVVGINLEGALELSDLDEDDTHVFSLLEKKGLGVFQLREDGSFTYIPVIPGQAVMVVAVKDSAGAVAQATLTINVSERAGVQSTRGGGGLGVWMLMVLVWLMIGREGKKRRYQCSVSYKTHM